MFMFVEFSRALIHPKRLGQKPTQNSGLSNAVLTTIALEVGKGLSDGK